MISFLSTKDILGLHSVNKACHNLISAREDVLFEEFLRRDFDEGNILSYIANKGSFARRSYTWHFYIVLVYRNKLLTMVIKGLLFHGVVQIN